MVDGADVQCFLSYHRRDNDTYDGVVDRLRDDIAGRFEAESGRSIHIFLDRDSIPGGGDWREKIAESIATATVFIPIVTMRYFASEQCREELLAFYDSANELGVTELILPVILAGQENITADHPLPEVQIIERLNYRSIGDAVDKGYQSPEWKSAVRQIVTDIAKGMKSAENALVQREQSGPPPSQRPSTLPSEQAGGPEDEDGVDIFDLREDLQELTPLAEQARDAMEDFGTIARDRSAELQELQNKPSKDQRAQLLRFANDLRPSSENLWTTGQNFESKVRDVDRALRSILGRLGGAGAYGDELKMNLTGGFSNMTAMTETIERLDDMTEMLSAISVMNVSLRRALTPGIQGMKAIRNAVSIATSWSNIANS